MKIISWNVNGLRACIEKGFEKDMEKFNPEIICLQETRMQKVNEEVDLKGYNLYWNSAEKKGYSGTAIFSKNKAMSVIYGFNDKDIEGRVLTLEFEDYYVVSVYSPNSQRGLLRLDYRLSWEDDFRNFLKSLDSKKPVIIAGDLNVAHEEIDIKNPKENKKNAGFTIEEREKMTELLNSGFTDTFRKLYPDKKDAYTWWSYRKGARERNIGWRLDYFLVSNRIMKEVKDSKMFPEIFGSDHCPLELIIEI